MSESSKVGQLSLYVGPMCSGKSDRLVDLHERARNNPHRRAAIIAPLISRDATSKEITSRTGKFCSADFVETLDSTLIGRFLNGEYTDVFVDEGQFFSKLGNDELFNFCDVLTRRGVDVYVAALNSDYMRRCWPSVTPLYALSPTIVQLSAWCTNCREDAVYTRRISSSRELVDVHGTYEPACRICYHKQE